MKYNGVLDRVAELAGRLKRKSMAGIDLPFIDAYRKDRTDAEAAARTIYNETMIIRQLVNFAMAPPNRHKSVGWTSPRRSLSQPRNRAGPQPKSSKSSRRRASLVRSRSRFWPTRGYASES